MWCNNLSEADAELMVSPQAEATEGSKAQEKDCATSLPSRGHPPCIGLYVSAAQ